MKTIVSNNIKIIDFQEDIGIEIWCDDNLVLDNPDWITANRRGAYIGNIPRKLVLYERKGNALVLPFGTLKSIWRFIKDHEIVLEFPQGEPLQMVGDIELYTYQHEALLTLISAKNGILQAPCGSGKTQIGLKLIKELNQKALWITHTLDLIDQAKSRAKQYYDGDFGIISGGQVEIGADITFATVQTLSAIDLSAYKNEWNVIIVDECHKVAGSPTRLGQFYKVLSNLSARHKFGLSATLHRGDNLIKSTFAIIGPLVYNITGKQVGDKTYKALHKKVPVYTPSSFKYLDTDGTLLHNELIDYLVNNVERNTYIAETIKEKNHYGLVLSHRVEHLNKLRELIGYGEILTGATRKKDRKAILEKARTGEVKLILSTYSLAKEGLDVPVLDKLFLVTPQKDYAIVKQSAGRIERNIEGKGMPEIYDFTDIQISYCERAYHTRKRILEKEL
jgi:superfamily II DNA or RNA helicase